MTVLLQPNYIKISWDMTWVSLFLTCHEDSEHTAPDIAITKNFNTYLISNIPLSTCHLLIFHLTALSGLIPTNLLLRSTTHPFSHLFIVLHTFSVHTSLCGILLEWWPPGNHVSSIHAIVKSPPLEKVLARRLALTLTCGRNDTALWEEAQLPCWRDYWKDHTKRLNAEGEALQDHSIELKRVQVISMCSQDCEAFIYLLMAPKYGSPLSNRTFCKALEDPLWSVFRPVIPLTSSLLLSLCLLYSCYIDLLVFPQRLYIYNHFRAVAYSPFL